MEVLPLIRNLREQGVSFTVVEGKLRISAPAGLLNTEVKELIKANKQQIVDALEAFRQLHESPYFTGYTGLSLF